MTVQDFKVDTPGFCGYRPPHQSGMSVLGESFSYSSPMGKPGGIVLNLTSFRVTDVERVLISEALRFSRGDHKAAVLSLGIDSRTLYRKLRQQRRQSGSGPAFPGESSSDVLLPQATEEKNIAIAEKQAGVPISERGTASAIEFADLEDLVGAEY